MTAQVPDTIRIGDDAYDIADTHGSGLFRAADHALPVVSASTECARGYRCGYAIVDGRLRLDAVDAMVGRDDGERLVPVEPPPINGRHGRAVGGRGQDFNTAYRDLDLDIAFTGELAIGRDRIDDLIGPTGAPPWAYRQVRALRFAAGALTGDHDLTAIMAAVRADPWQADRRRQAAPELERDGLAWIVDASAR